MELLSTTGSYRSGWSKLPPRVATPRRGISRMTNVADSPWHRAARDGDVDMLRSCLGDGQSLGELAWFDGTEADAIMIASAMGQLEAAHFLVQAGADVNAKNEYGA